MRIVTIEEPTEEPVTVEEAKLYTRVDLDDDDDLFEMFITAARLHVEQYCNLALVTQTRAIYLDGCDIDFRESILNIPFGPIQEIESFNSVDEESESTLFPDSDYYLSGQRVALNASSYWPDNIRDFDAYRIEVVAGYGDAEDVPRALKQTILRLVAHWYQNREASYDSVNGTFNYANVPYSVTCALAPYRNFYL